MRPFCPITAYPRLRRKSRRNCQRRHGSASAGAGTKGPRWYDLAWQPLWRLPLTSGELASGHWLVMRRCLKKPYELAYFRSIAQCDDVTLKTQAQVAGRRWTIEPGF